MIIDLLVNKVRFLRARSRHKTLRLKVARMPESSMAWKQSDCPVRAVDNTRTVPFNPEVVLANMHGSFTGVSATIANLAEHHARRFDTAIFGQELATGVRRFGWWGLARLLWRRPAGRRVRIWHARRNPEMWLGLVLKHVLRSPVKLVFTTVALRRHSRIPRALISAMDAIIATTPEAASFVPRCDAVVPHGVDTDVFVPPDDKRRAWQETGLPGRYGIGTFGRVRPEKGTDRFVEAMCRVLPKYPEFTAVIAGRWKGSERPFQESLARRIAAAGLSERVIWLGEVPASERHLWFQRISLCVAAPRYEGYGLTPLEAMACGAAVVATRTGIFPTLIEDAQTGYVVDVDDRDSLADRIARCLRDPQALLEMGRRGRQHIVDHYDIRLEATGIERVYASLFAGEFPATGKNNFFISGGERSQT